VKNAKKINEISPLRKPALHSSSEEAAQWAGQRASYLLGFFSGLTLLIRKLLISLTPYPWSQADRLRGVQRRLSHFNNYFFCAMKTWLLTFGILFLLQCMTLAASAQGRLSDRDIEYPEWKTNTEKRSINLKDLIRPGMPKDGIPAIDNPRFVTISQARKWLAPNEPVIALEVNGISRAYPMQILIWHEVANDQIGRVPVVITFCSICNSAIVFKRKLGDRVLSFGIAGFVHGANMVLYDRQTESWWQQFTGEAIVGDLTSKKLSRLPSQIISFAQFSSAFPGGAVLSRQTGYVRDYGRNPHIRYDDIERSPSHFRGKIDERLIPMEKVIGIEIGDKAKAYPHKISSVRRVIYDRLGSQEIVVFHSEGATSALDAEDMRKSREVGSTGVFDPHVDGRRLEFSYEGGQFVDAETGSRWNILGKAVSGSLRGKSLKPISHGDYFAFAWLAFKPKTDIFKD
jgi:uncharacterized protein DUF3179